MGEHTVHWHVANIFRRLGVGRTVRIVLDVCRRVAAKLEPHGLAAARAFSDQPTAGLSVDVSKLDAVIVDDRS